MRLAAGILKPVYGENYEAISQTQAMLGLPVTNRIASIPALSRRVFVHAKASKRRCSTPTASFDNVLCKQNHFGLSLLWVAVLDKTSPFSANLALIKHRFEALKTA